MFSWLLDLCYQFGSLCESSLLTMCRGPIFGCPGRETAPLPSDGTINWLPYVHSPPRGKRRHRCSTYTPTLSTMMLLGFSRHALAEVPVHPESAGIQRARQPCQGPPNVFIVPSPRQTSCSVYPSDDQWPGVGTGPGEIVCNNVRTISCRSKVRGIRRRQRRHRLGLAPSAIVVKAALGYGYNLPRAASSSQ